MGNNSLIEPYGIDVFMVTNNLWCKRSMLISISDMGNLPKKKQQQCKKTLASIA